MAWHYTKASFFVDQHSMLGTLLFVFSMGPWIGSNLLSIV